MKNKTFNYGLQLTNTKDTFNESIKKTYSIKSIKKPLMDTTTLYHEIEKKELCNLFNNLYKNFDNAIMDTSKKLAVSIINSMYRTMYKVIDKESSTEDNIVYKWIHGVNYMSCKKIVESGFTDSIFEDIVQTIALYLCENIDTLDYINYNNEVYMSIKEVYLDVYKVVRKYLYNNMQKQDNKERCIMMLEVSDGLYYEVDSLVNSHDFKKWSYEEMQKDNVNIDLIINNICDFVMVYTLENLKRDIVLTVLYSLASGETSKECKLANNTYFKYKKAILECCDNVVKLDYKVSDFYKDTTATTENPHNTFTVDFTNKECSIFDTLVRYSKDITNEERLTYNNGVKSLFYSHDGKNKNLCSHMRIHGIEKLYRKELQLDRMF